MITRTTLLYCLLIASSHAAESARFSRPVELTDDSGQALIAVTLDDAVYANTAADFRDLRLIDQDGVETPHLLQKVAGHTRKIKRLPSRSEILSMEKIGEEGIDIILALDKDAADADGLSVVTAQRDFEYNLQVLGSTDRQNWKPLVDNTMIYDYSRYMEIGSRDINLPVNSYRFFKIVVAKATQTRTAGLSQLSRTLQRGEEIQRMESTDVRHEPLHIDRIDLWYNQTETVVEAEQPVEYPLTVYSITEDAKLQTSLIEIETQRQPLTGFRLTAKTPNFRRNAEVQIQQQLGMANQWQTIGRASLEALHFQDLAREQTTLTFPEQRLNHYRMIIHNQDNPPLAIETLTGIGRAYQLLFLPRAGQHYSLQYGDATLPAPRYDTAQIQELLRRGYQSTSVALGPETAALQPAVGFDPGKWLNSRLFLSLAIGLMVVVLSWSLYRANKYLRDMND